MSYIDFIAAKNAFLSFVDNYPREEERIEHKIQHSLRVSEKSMEIAEALKLSEEDTQLARLIGLIHDIGRFDQYITYGTFIDRESEDHALIGVRVLFEKNMLHDFLDTDKYNDIIKLSVKYHNAYSIPEDISGKTLLHCKIIRDSDKLDNLYCKEFESFSALFGKDDISDEIVTDKVMRDFLNHKLIKHTDTVTNKDTWLKYTAFHYGLYFKESRAIAQKGNYGKKMLLRAGDGDDIKKARNALSAFLSNNVKMD